MQYVIEILKKEIDKIDREILSIGNSTTDPEMNAAIIFAEEETANLKANKTQLQDALRWILNYDRLRKDVLK